MLDTLTSMLTSLLTAEFGLPLISSLITGMLIGLDRELQGKPAGLRTHTLVGFASTLLTLAAAHQGEWTVNLLPSTDLVSDPTRMAHGILTGIGFLGAGVIFKEGSSVHGLTTAASLWATAALGIIYGVGMFELALVGTVATLAVLVVLRFVYAALPNNSGLRLTITASLESGFDAVAVQELLRAHDLPHQPLSESYDGRTGTLEFATSTSSRSASKCRKLADALKGSPAVLGFTMLFVENAGARDTGG